MKKTGSIVYFDTNLTYDVSALYESIVNSSVMDVIMPGDKVLIKPNWVQESHNRNESWEQMITHPTLITAVLKHVLEKLAGSGSVVIADSPMTPANFEKILAHMPIKKWKAMCSQASIKFSIIDMRNECWDTKDGIIIAKHTLQGDPNGHVLFDLQGGSSEFNNKEKPQEGYYGASYDTEETNLAHDGFHNQYEMAYSVIDADVFINLPKVKTHRKAGLTCSLKNLVGISTNKNLIPHHSAGTPAEGGDQFAINGNTIKLEGSLTAYAKNMAKNSTLVAYFLVPLKKLARVIFGDNSNTVRNGSWWGNDTLWRSIVDLNKLLLYGNVDASLRSDCEDSKKRYISICDGIICGEGDGPLEPDAVNAGFVVCGTNAVAVDCVVARLSGLDYAKIPSIAKAFESKLYKLVSFSYDDIVCIDATGKTSALKDISPLIFLRPASGWVNHIELDSVK